MKQITFPTVEGIEFFLAGGAVRDILMNKEPKDEDYVIRTDMTFEDTVKTLEDNGFKIFTTKPEFNIILTRYEGRNIDLAFPRKDGNYTDGRRPDHTTRVNDLCLDSLRRDFTINACFMDSSGNILDYHGGKDDIKQGLIRCVGDPYERFDEDALRLLRAIRFAVQLGFEIEQETAEAMFSCRMYLLRDTIVTDRIKAEVNKSLKKGPVKTMELLYEMSMLTPIYEKDKNFRFELVNRT